IDSDKANIAGVTNLDVAAASATAMNGYQVATLREGNEQIPVVARLRMTERAQPSDVQHLYGYAYQGSQTVTLGLISTIECGVEPFLVSAAIPYGMVGAVAALWVMGAPFGFMAFLGVASLVGVIVSHVIVLFDFIEEKHAEGEPLEQALLDAGIMRLRPVMITVGAAVIALFPLAAHGGPLWEPLAYPHVGRLVVAA